MSEDKEQDVADQVAIALKYDIDSMPAPQVVAKGQGHLAEQILKIAEENGIEIRKDAPLTEILAVLEVDSFIPLDAYAAVAEILSYMYDKNAKATNVPNKDGSGI